MPRSRPRRSFTLRERKLFKDGTAHLASYGFHKYGQPINTRQDRRRRALARKAFPSLPVPKPHTRPLSQTFPDHERTDLYAVSSIYWGVFSSCGRRVPRRGSNYDQATPWGERPATKLTELVARHPTVWATGPLEYAVPRWCNICKVSRANLKIYRAWLDAPYLQQPRRFLVRYGP